MGPARVGFAMLPVGVILHFMQLRAVAAGLLLQAVQGREQAAVDGQEILVRQPELLAGLVEIVQPFFVEIAHQPMHVAVFPPLQIPARQRNGLVETPQLFRGDQKRAVDGPLLLVHVDSFPVLDGGDERIVGRFPVACRFGLAPRIVIGRVCHPGPKRSAHAEQQQVQQR